MRSFLTEIFSIDKKLGALRQSNTNLMIEEIPCFYVIIK